MHSSAPQAVAWPKVPSALRHTKICTCERETLWLGESLVLPIASKELGLFQFPAVQCRVSVHLQHYLLMPDLVIILQIHQNCFRDHKEEHCFAVNIKKQRLLALRMALQ